MGKYDFDKIVDRHGTNSIKHDMVAPGGRKDAIPLFIADMDFDTPQPIIDALQKRVALGGFGYTFEPDSYYESVISWQKRRHGIDVKKEWIKLTPGVMTAVNLALRGLTEQGDAVMTQEPIYDPFQFAVANNDRKWVKLVLKNHNGRYEMDFDEMERLIKENNVKLFLLCNPHNPCGTAWNRDELETVDRICRENGVKIICDEIHGDFVYKPKKHVSFYTLSEEARNNCILCTAASKTFSIPGLEASNIIIENPELRKIFETQQGLVGLYGVNMLGTIATAAAYDYCEDWFDECREYIDQNITKIVEFCNVHFPKMNIHHNEGTYLMWLDFSYLGISQEELLNKIYVDAGVWLNDGLKYGEHGLGFLRLNAASPWSVIEKALNRLADVLEEK